MTPTITQSDRDGAADMIRTYWRTDTGCYPEMEKLAKSIEAGSCDHCVFVQTIAHARIAGWNAAVKTSAEVGFQRALNGGKPRDVFDAVHALHLNQEGKDDG